MDPMNARNQGKLRLVIAFIDLLKINARIHRDYEYTVYMMEDNDAWIW